MVFLPACEGQGGGETGGGAEGGGEEQKLTEKDLTHRPNWAFVSLGDLDPSIIIEMRYFTDHNFVGKPIRGYNAPKCYLTWPAAIALTRVQAELKPMNLTLKVYDCYRPQRAVDHFVEWAKDLGDTKMRKEFYPTVDKSRLFLDGYIAEKSGHTRGSTFDVTIVSVPAGEQEVYKDGDALRECTLPAAQRFKDNTLDFGTGYDCFDVQSHAFNPALPETHRGLRMLLHSIMDKHGFKGLAEEWWHFTLKNEPFPKTYFNFPID
ncbi:M15 family metallopeptidase [Pendulispora albinea]|uniref:D-alanyl-D-alanine dipeptidase n=1 Tax=Pendulispora albinea TaxID=2741071 RepID=A0ABZ2MCM5_9BACT